MEYNSISEILTKINWLISLKKYPLAEKMALDLIAQYPDICNGYSCLTRIQLAQNRLEEAEETLDTMMGICPDYAHTYYLFADLYLSKNDNHSSLKWIEQALQLEADNLFYQYHKALIYYNLSRFVESEKMCEEILSQDAELIYVLNLYGLCLYSQGKEKEADEVFDKSQQQTPNSSDLYSKRGIAAMNRKEYKKAISLFEEALRLDPTCPDATRYINALKAREAHNPYVLKAGLLWKKYYATNLHYAALAMVPGLAQVWSKPELIPVIGGIVLIIIFPFLVLFALSLFHNIYQEVIQSRSKSTDVYWEYFFGSMGVILAFLWWKFGDASYYIRIGQLNGLLLIMSVSEYQFSVKYKVYKGKIGFPIALHFAFLASLWIFTALSGTDSKTMGGFALGFVLTVVLTIGAMYGDKMN